LVYADYVNVLGEIVHTVKENATALVVACEEIRLEVNAEKFRYMVISQDQHPRQNHYMKLGNKLFETVEEFKYFETTLKIKISFVKKLRACGSQGMLAIIWCRYFVFQFAIEKCKDTQNYNFACCFVWA
jgi:hypothetical protein